MTASAGSTNARDGFARIMQLALAYASSVLAVERLGGAGEGDLVAEWQKEQVGTERYNRLTIAMHAERELETSVSDMADDARAWEAVKQLVPSSVDDAMLTVGAMQVEYQLAAKRFQKLSEAWRNQDVLSSRQRRAAVKRLMEEQGMSATAADKAASDDPEYAAHKDQLAKLATEKDDAEMEYKVAAEGIKTARLFLTVQHQLELEGRMLSCFGHQVRMAKISSVGDLVEILDRKMQRRRSAAQPAAETPSPDGAGS